MRPILVLLGPLVFMLGLSALILSIPEPINGHGMAHLTVEGMRQQTDPVFGVGDLLGILIYLVISVLVYLAIQPAKRDRKLVLAHTAATLLVLGVWSC